MSDDTKENTIEENASEDITAYIARSFLQDVDEIIVHMGNKPDIVIQRAKDT